MYGTLHKHQSSTEPTTNDSKRNGLLKGNVQEAASHLDPVPSVMPKQYVAFAFRMGTTYTYIYRNVVYLNSNFTH